MRCCSTQIRANMDRVADGIQPAFYTEEGGVMSDGREEREENRRRREQESRENREDRINRGYVDEWEPERVDS
jgi:hypothetical protein